MKGDINHIYNNTVFNNTGIDISILNESMVDPNDSNNTLYSNQNTVTRNNLAGQISGHRSNPSNLGGTNAIPGTVNNNVYSETSTVLDVTALLEDPNNKDFRPKTSASALINTGVADDTSGLTPEITTNSIGLPDIGAYELGGTNWVPGVTWTPDFYPWSFLSLSVHEDKIPANQLILYPNPATGKIYFKVTNKIKVNHISVYSLKGNKVIETKVTNNAIDVSSLSSGIYMLKLTLNNGTFYSKKIIVK